ncbi:AMP-binding protein [Nakamurella aerolata]|uniref:AMP-binding protein n=1 Tax=Nakamurella aerolata TaxID=1656892 RepID=A0A849A2K5_9ACTN|nr:AMP-binding protein [Nakamurella aerolata]NNG34839.1 AMP-binding protein [Nakamurella aerolata]
MTAQHTAGTGAVLGARTLLVDRREDLDAAVRDFRWPELTEFNWGLEWFDVLAAEHPDRPALTIVEEDGSVTSASYQQLSQRSDQLANHLRALGVRRGQRIVLMLGNQIELWETILAAIKLGAVIIPASTLLAPADLTDRVSRGGAQYVVARSQDAAGFSGVPDSVVRISVGADTPDGWHAFAESHNAPVEFQPDGPTAADSTLLLYFTSGTTALPKLVEHTHVSYPVGHLSTVYWVGLRPGDVHLNISSPGWAKHAWSNVFAPWLAGATVFIYNYTRFDASALMRVMGEHGVTTFCAPPTVWRMLIQADLSQLATPPREAIAAGEPLNPEVIDRVRKGWGVTIRDGFGQTETTLAVANTPGQPVKDGSMGRPLPGYPVVLIDPATGELADEGEICFDLDHRPLGLTPGYFGDEERTAEAMRDGYYHTGDVGSRDHDGYITYVGRADDVFKASDYRISPFELESVLIEHPAVAEAAVVPSPDPVRLAVPKAYVVLADGHQPNADTARDILAYAREQLAPYKRIRRLEFTDLPKTISGKIRRVELRGREQHLHPDGAPVDGEFRWEDLVQD